MNKQVFAAGLIGTLLGLIIGVGAMSVLGSQPSKNNPSQANSMHDSMAGMMAGLHGKSGDQFDQAFLQEMVVHHQGAVSMAKAALMHAEHQELRDLATNIITAQEGEISQMQTWLQQWYQK